MFLIGGILEYLKVRNVLVLRAQLAVLSIQKLRTYISALQASCSQHPPPKITFLPRPRIHVHAFSNSHHSQCLLTLLSVHLGVSE